MGKVVVVRLGTNQGERSSLIYRGPDNELIKFSRESFYESGNCEEKDMLNIQKAFFKKICDQLIFGAYGEKLKNKVGANAVMSTAAKLAPLEIPMIPGSASGFFNTA